MRRGRRGERRKGESKKEKKERRGGVVEKNALWASDAVPDGY
jgi:hypothetical protein